MADIATFDINTVKASEYTYTADTTHNIELSRALNLSGVPTIQEFMDDNTLWTGTYGPFHGGASYNSDDQLLWKLDEDFDLTSHIWIQAHELLTVEADLDIQTNGKITLAGEIDISGGTLNIGGGSIESTSQTKTKFEIEGGDFYELFYNNQWWRSTQNTKDKTFSIPEYKNGSWINGRGRTKVITDSAITKLFSLYTWNRGEGGDSVVMNLANFAIDQWVKDISNNQTTTTVETVTITTTSNDTTTTTANGSSTNIPSSNVGLRQELMAQSYLNKLNNCLTGSLTWGNLLKAVDSKKGILTTRFDLVDTPKSALQSGDDITIIIMVANKNALAENIFLRLPFEIK
jgi:hypothetical protein